MRFALAAAVLCCLCVAAFAGAPDEFAQTAGPQPRRALARQAVIDELSRSSKGTADVKSVRFLSGPRLVTGINFADGREQAWLMCVVAADASGARRRAEQDIGVKPYLLRNRDGMLEIIPIAGWKESDAGC